jgi:iron(III) transport system ATP-binding protein
MGTPVSLREITKTYPAAGKAAPLTVVDQVTLEIAGGEMFFLLGPSGCGKTTLLRMIAGFIEPTKGSILFGARDVTYTAPQDRNTGMVFQSYATWPHMTVRGNVAFGLETRRTPAAELAERVNGALAMVQMEALAERRPTQLSGGQQQRVALARAIAVRPDVLLLDEPLSNLDAKLRVELRGEIRRVCKAAGITSIYVTHDQREALSIADRIAVRRAGRIEQVGPPVDLYRRPETAFCAGFMGEVNQLPPGMVQPSATTRQDGGVVVRMTTALGEITGVAPRPVEGRAEAFVRPEALRIAQPGMDRSTWNMVGPIQQVGEVAFLGEVWNREVVVGGSHLRMTGLGSALPTTPGPETMLAFPVEETTILPVL